MPKTHAPTTAAPTTTSTAVPTSAPTPFGVAAADGVTVMHLVKDPINNEVGGVATVLSKQLSKGNAYELTGYFACSKACSVRVYGFASTAEVVLANSYDVPNGGELLGTVKVSSAKLRKHKVNLSFSNAKVATIALAIKQESDDSEKVIATVDKLSILECKDKFQIHVVDLNGVKRTYDVKPSDLLGELRQIAADDASMDVSDVNLKKCNRKCPRGRFHRSSWA